MPRLSIDLLGPFQVRLDAKPVTAFEANTARALLAYLACHAGTCTLGGASGCGPLRSVP